MHILAFLLIIIIAVFVMALAAIGNILRAVFGIGRRNGNDQSKRYTHNTTQQDNTQKSKTTENVNGKKQGKVFTQDEGEYVDFEEIKD